MAMVGVIVVEAVRVWTPELRGPTAAPAASDIARGRLRTPASTRRLGYAPSGAAPWTSDMASPRGEVDLTRAGRRLIRAVCTAATLDIVAAVAWRITIDHAAVIHEGALRGLWSAGRAAARTMPWSAIARRIGGDSAYRLGDVEEALDDYRAAARMAPSAENRLLVGSLAADIGATDVALESLRAGMKPGEARRGAAATRLFRLLVESRDDAAALQVANEMGWIHAGREYCRPPAPDGVSENGVLLALLLEPSHADCLLSAGISLTNDGLVNLARRVLVGVIENNPDAQTRETAEAFLRHRLPPRDVVQAAEALNIVGYNLQYAFRCRGLALEAYQRAIAVDPGFSWPYSNIGQVYVETNELPRAFDWFAKAVDVNPNHWKAQANLGWVAVRLGRYDDAVLALRRAVALNPGDGWGHSNLGRLLLARNEGEAGRRELEVARRLDPSLVIDPGVSDGAGETHQ